MNRFWLVLRRTVGRWFGVVVVGLVVLAAVGGWATYTGHVDPGTHTERETVAAWSPTDTVRHSARVTKLNPVFPRNVTLENRSAYLTRASPRFRAQFAPGYTATDDGNVTTTVVLSVVRRAVVTGEGPGADEQTLWQTERRLRTERGRLAPGEQLSAETELNATRLDGETDALVASLGGSPGEVYTEVRAEIRLVGTVADRPVETTWTRRLRVEVADGVYRLTPVGATPGGREWTRTVVVPNDPGLPRQVGGPVALLVGLAGLAVAVVGRRAGAFRLDPVESEWLAYRSDASEFGEWVIDAEVPRTLTDGTVAEANSLSDLVDLAIDADEAVLRGDTGDYFVRYGEVVYVYSPPEPEVVRARGGFDLGDGLPSVGLSGTNDEQADGRASRADGGGAGATPSFEETTTDGDLEEELRDSDSDEELRDSDPDEELRDGHPDDGDTTVDPSERSNGDPTDADAEDEPDTTWEGEPGDEGDEERS
ncbi:DUF5305 family protein [Halobaculum sp. MBLA0143]|uniref:DUF5305 family protein n=1 Tax=Halobaculum sp. MBLA0143 TaxID=3079933 RepID=UPI0035268195